MQFLRLEVKILGGPLMTLLRGFLIVYRDCEVVCRGFESLFRAE